MDPFIKYNYILEKYLKKEIIPFINAGWNEPHRVYHNVTHLNNILTYIESKHFDLNPIDYETLVLAAFFHDVYYNTRDFKNNEDESVKRFMASYDYENNNVRTGVVLMIETTKYRKRPTNHRLLTLFWDADNAGFYKDYNYQLATEAKIRREYIHIPNKIYQKSRIKFLESNLGLFSKKVDDNINQLIKYIQKIY